MATVHQSRFFFCVTPLKKGIYYCQNMYCFYQMILILEEFSEDILLLDIVWSSSQNWPISASDTKQVNWEEDLFRVWDSS